MRYYFAYGSNMFIGQMLRRCPKAQYVKREVLNGFQFFINKRGVASIRKKKGSKVIGVIWKINSYEEIILDMYEGVNSGFYKKFYKEFLIGGENRKVLIYVDLSKGEGIPREGYMEKILKGANDFIFPEKYVKELETWSKYEREINSNINNNPRITVNKV